MVHVSRIHIEPKADIFFTFPVGHWQCIQESDKIVDQKRLSLILYRSGRKSKNYENRNALVGSILDAIYAGIKVEISDKRRDILQTR